jgi:hypothetical protein
MFNNINLTTSIFNYYQQKEKNSLISELVNKSLLETLLHSNKVSETIDPNQLALRNTIIDRECFVTKNSIFLVFTTIKCRNYIAVAISESSIGVYDMTTIWSNNSLMSVI